MEEEKAPPSPPAAKSPSQMKLVIVGAVALFIALVGAQVAVPLINSLIAGSQSADAAEGEDGEIVLAEGDVADEALDDGDSAEDEPLAPALYTALDPPFVVSFEQEDGARYVQMTLQAMARDEETIAAVKQHSPAIRNSVLFLVSGFELEALTTQAGKEQLRKDLLVAANEILAKNGAEESIEELYFTSLVIQ
jgi:flagellar protein FliL